MQFMLRFGLASVLALLLPGWAAAQVVDRHTSTVQVDRTTALASGTDQVVVTVRVLETNQQPYAGKQVTLSLSGPGDTIVQPGLTDSNGVCVGTVATISSGLRTVKARVLNDGNQVLLDQQPTIDFEATLVLTQAKPRFVPVDGASPITLRGAGFGLPGVGTPTVRFGGLAASSVVVVSDSTITCVAPAPDPTADPTVDVTLETGLGDRTLARNLTYADQIRTETFDDAVLPSWLEETEGGPPTISGGALRAPVDDDSGASRRYLRTARKDYIVRDFVFEATMNVGPTPENTNPMLFAGVGRGEPDFEFHREPRWCFGFRLHPPPVQGGNIEVAGTMERGNFRWQVGLANQASQGTRRVRIEKQGPAITFSIMMNWTGGAYLPDASYVFDDIIGGAPANGTDSSALYFGSGGTQSTIDDVTVVVLPPRAGLVSFEPRFGLDAGGESITLRGRGFLSGGSPSVTFGGRPATSVVVVDDRTVTCVAPSADLLDAPFVDVTLANSHGTTTHRRGYCYATQLRSSDFNSGTLPPWLEDATGAFGFEDGELKETSPDPDPALRTYLRTTSTLYDQKDFVYELTVRAGEGHIGAVGLGTADPDPALDGEPTDSLFVRVRSFEAGSGHFDLVLQSATEQSTSDIGESWVRGHRRMRLIKQGHRLGIHDMERWPGTGPFKPELTYAIEDLRVTAPFLDAGRLFFGGSAPSFRWDELRIATLRNTPVRLIAVDSPDGTRDGGVLVTIRGLGFNTLGPAPVVTFDGVPATGVTVLTNQALTCVTPPGPLGRVAVQVRGAAGSGLLLEGYRYGF